MDEILALIKAGKTPESIYEDALAAVAQMNKEKNDKEVAEARDTIVKALDLYMYALTGEHISTADAAEVEGLLKEVEKIVFPIKNKDKSKKKKTDDEIMEDFLKTIMK